MKCCNKMFKMPSSGRPLLNAAEIGVSAKDGVVTLTGTVDSYAKKTEAEDAAKNVKGVKAVVEDIEIKFASTWKKTDSEIANEVINALQLDWAVPKEKVKVKVEDGWVTLEGELPWNSQKDSAKKKVRSLAGVKGVMNYITIKTENTDDVEKLNIENALKRNWSIDNQHIRVKVSGNNVTLNGKANDDGIHELWGELTMIGVTKNIKLEVEFGGIIRDPWTNEKAGFSITGKIKRSDWGLVWNATIEAGGVLVSDDILIFCEVELTNIGFKDLIMEVIENKDEVLDTM
jgi:osmotically-inducible protein OsmY